MSTTKQDNLTAGIDCLSALKLSGSNYAYYASEVGAWYLVDAYQIEALGADLAVDSDAYSAWCSGVGSGESISDVEACRLGLIEPRELIADH